MERLTKTYSDGTHGANDNLPCGENSYTYKGLLLEALGKYEDAEEQGLLLRLPCKVGDTVYVPTRDFISELRIVHISISKNNTFFHWMLNAGIYPNLDGFSVDKIGEVVFLTKSEAEAKLKELRGGENDRISKN